MAGQYSNFQGIRMVSLDATKSNLNILMEVGVIYRLTNVQNLAGRQGPLFWFPPFLPGLSVLATMPSASGTGAVGLSFLQAQNISDAVGIAAPIAGSNPLTQQGTIQNVAVSGFSSCFFSVQNAGSFSFPVTVQLMLTQSEGSTLAAGGGAANPARRSFIATNTPLGASATFTGPWIDTTQTGDQSVEASVLANVAGGNPPGFRIEGTDDTVNFSPTTLAFFLNPNGTGVSAGTLSSIVANVPMRFWRVVYVNSTTAQASMELTITASPVFNSNLFPRTGAFMINNQAAPNIGDFSGSSNAWALLTAPSVGAIALIDNQSNTSVVAGLSGSTSGPIASPFNVFNSWYNGTGWDRARTPVIFKTVQATAAGSTALWTPTAGKKFRLMRLLVLVTENASLAAAGTETISLLDAAAATNIAFDVFLPNAAGANAGEAFTSGWIDLGNGYLSTTANNVLNVSLSAALATGVCRLIACGTEE